ALPVPPASADVVCACHVLEHIPAAGRDAFLDKLVAAAKGPSSSTCRRACAWPWN
ncbi:MAG: hypothetical protein IH621_03910, partial [Krumholzibacteria bacterium]|nr:hypothetical protein [Candidatus Krumholzibacteria bacterium]